jgi:hypothetical protein
VFISGVFTPAGPGTDIKEYELANRDVDPAVFAVASCPANANEDGCIILRGVVQGWNTSSYTAGDDLYLTDTPGQYTTTKPTSGAIFFVGKVIRAANEGIVFVSPNAEVEGARVVISTTAPSNPAEGDLWFDSTALDLYIYYNDGDSTQWVGVGGGGGGAEVGEYELTIETTDWTEQTSGDWESQFLAVLTLTGILSTDNPIVDLDLSDTDVDTAQAIVNSFNKLFAWQATDDNEITFYASQEPQEDIKVHVKVVK